MRRTLLAVSAAAAVLLLPSAAQAAEGDIIVQREAGLDRREQRELRADAGVRHVSDLTMSDTELVEPRHGDVSAALAELRADDDVVFAEPDRRVSASTNDFYWTSLWGLDNLLDTDIDAPEAWLRSRGAGITVAVADTGVNADHEDLAGKIVPGWDFVSGDATPQDGNGHGTHVAGTIAATGANGSGLTGVAPDAKVMPLRVLDDEGSGCRRGLRLRRRSRREDRQRVARRQLRIRARARDRRASPHALRHRRRQREPRQRRRRAGRLPVRTAAVEHPLHRRERQPGPAR
jgi:hypothetical protein